MEMEQKWGMGIGGGYSLLCVIIVSFTLESLSRVMLTWTYHFSSFYSVLRRRLLLLM